MQRLVNEKDHVVEDMLEGYVQAKSYIEYGGSEKRVVKYTDIPQGKVGLVSGGGSGHEPAFLGYIGKNMLDAVAIGEVFSSPTANAFLDAFREANHENGVACLFGNYAGDNMNVKMAKAMAEDEGIQVRYQMSATRILRFRRVPMNLASVIMENPVWISVLWPVQRK